MAQSDIKIIKNKFNIISKFFKDISFEEFNFIENKNKLSKILIKDKYLFCYKLNKESEILSTNNLFQEVEYSLNFELDLISDNNSSIDFFKHHINEEYKSTFNIFYNLYKELNETYKLKKITTSFNFDLLNKKFSNTIFATITILDKIDFEISFQDGSINYVDIITESTKKTAMPSFIFFNKITYFSIENINILIVKKLFKFLNYENEKMDQEHFINLLENHYDDLIKLSTLSSY